MQIDQRILGDKVKKGLATIENVNDQIHVRIKRFSPDDGSPLSDALVPLDEKSIDATIAELDDQKTALQTISALIKAAKVKK